jgi:hypothetical protein
MQCLGCGGVWFSEVKQVIAPDAPASDVHQARPTRARYVYTCAACSLGYGEKPKAKRKKRS